MSSINEEGAEMITPRAPSYEAGEGDIHTPGEALKELNSEPFLYLVDPDAPSEGFYREGQGEDNYLFVPRKEFEPSRDLAEMRGEPRYRDEEFGWLASNVFENPSEIWEKVYQETEIPDNDEELRQYIEGGIEGHEKPQWGGRLLVGSFALFYSSVVGVSASAGMSQDFPGTIGGTSFAGMLLGVAGALVGGEADNKFSAQKNAADEAKYRQLEDAYIVQTAPKVVERMKGSDISIVEVEDDDFEDYRAEAGISKNLPGEEIEDLISPIDWKNERGVTPIR